MPERTLNEAADEIHAAVREMRTLITQEYPTRREIERRFMAKSQSNARIWAVAVAVASSLILSYFVTISTVSTCFLGSASDGHPAVCNLMPGYAEAQRTNQELLRQFVELQERSIKNEERINELEKERP